MASFDNIYLIVSAPEEMTFKADYAEYSRQSLDNKTEGFLISLNSEMKTIEFAVPGKHLADDFMIFASPNIDGFFIDEYACGDGKCEEDKGEDYRICSADCNAPLWNALRWVLGIIVFVGIALFFIWRYYSFKYDKNLKAKLFKNEGDYYNIASFISAEINKGSKEREIKANLQKAGWKNSQIEYALDQVQEKLKENQKRNLLAFIEREAMSGKSEKDIRERLKDEDWNKSLVEWAVKKAKKDKRLK